MSVWNTIIYIKYKLCCNVRTLYSTGALQILKHELQNIIDKIPKGDVFVMTGDLNAKVGEDNTDTAGVTGKFGYVERNVKGDRLIDSVEQMGYA